VRSLFWELSLPSLTKQAAADKSTGRHLAYIFETWNRKLHYYVGLYLLLFLWLFAFTGLLLNHPSWAFAEFWANRTVSTYERQIQPSPAGGDLSQARDIMRQLAIDGEIEWTDTNSDASHFDFRVSRPGHIFEIKIYTPQKRATIQRIDFNLWGVARVLHTFTGVRMGDPRNHRDWSLTTMWALSMDGLAAGLILMVLSSVYMWWDLKQKRWLGLLVLGLGLLSCGFFVMGLRWVTHNALG
jgi:hypothetical protein